MQDLIPYLVRHQYSRKARPPGQRAPQTRVNLPEAPADSDADPAPSPPEGRDSETSIDDGGGKPGSGPAGHVPGMDFMRISHSAAAEAAGGAGWLCAAYIPGPDVYCARAASVTSYCEVNRWAPGLDQHYSVQCLSLGGASNQDLYLVSTLESAPGTSSSNA